MIVDGQPGCGKTLFNRIFNSFKNIEIYRYSSEIENISSFYFHNKIIIDAAKFFLETYTDETLYSQMMGRNTNFRYSDLSSVFKVIKNINILKEFLKKEMKLYQVLLKSINLYYILQLIIYYQDLRYFSKHLILI